MSAARTEKGLLVPKMMLLDRRRPIATGLVTLSLLFSPAAHGQENQETTPTTASEEPVAPAEPRPIPASDILSRADDVLDDLRRIEALLAPDDEVAAIKTATDELAPKIGELRRELDALDADQISMRTLEDLRLEWADSRTKLDGWTSALDKRWKGLQDERQKLRKAQSRWELTREAATPEQFPPELLERIDSIIGKLSEVDDRIRERSDAVAAVITQVSNEKERADEALERLAGIATEIRGRVFTRDAPPIWELASTVDPGSLALDAQKAEQTWGNTLVQFVDARPDRFYSFLALFLVFLLITLVVRQRSRSWPADDERLAAASFVVSRPFAAALWFMLIAWAFFVTDAPSPIQDILTFLVIIPVLRLGTGLVAPSFRPVLYGVVGLTLFNGLWSLAPDGSLLERLLLLLGTALALVGLALLIPRWRSIAGFQSRGWVRAAWAGLAVAGILLAVSFLGNVLGWLSLAKSLNEATIISIYGAIAWLVAVKALTAMVPPMTLGPLGRIFLSTRRHERQFYRTTALLITALAFISWGRSTLSSFQLYEPLQRGFAELLSASLSWGGLKLSVGSLLAAIVILLLTFPVARLVRFALQEEVLPRFRLPAGADHSVVTLVNYAVLALAVLLAAAAAGLTATQLTVVFGALGVGIGFGLQNIVNNFVSGLVLIFERPIKVGDLIQMGNNFGIVNQIGIRASTIRKFDGAEVLVPNGDLISKEVTNWTLSDQLRRVEVTVGVAHGTDPSRVLEILKQLAVDHPRVLESPEPVAIMIGFGENSFNFRLMAWTRIENFLMVSSEIHVAVTKKLGEAGIEIPRPQRDLRVRAGDPSSLPVGDSEERKVKTKAVPEAES